MTQRAAVVTQTDFTKGISTCTMDGVCMMVDPQLRTFDNTHDIPAFDTYTASTSLDFVVDYWPAGTVFVSVVDPGVGTSRRGCVAKLKNGSFVVTPDNGTLTHMLRHPGIEQVRQIDEHVNRLPGSEGINIFHGRDVFAYTAARLAAGKISYEEVGPAYPVEEIVRHPLWEPRVEDAVITGMIATADTHFGLVCSNIPMELFAQQGIVYGDVLEASIINGEALIYHADVPYVPSFGAVAVGEPLLMNSEVRTIQIAINQKNISSLYGIGCGPDWSISLQRR